MRLAWSGVCPKYFCSSSATPSKSMSVSSAEGGSYCALRLCLAFDRERIGTFKASANRLQMRISMAATHVRTKTSIAKSASLGRNDRRDQTKAVIATLRMELAPTPIHSLRQRAATKAMPRAETAKRGSVKTAAARAKRITAPKRSKASMLMADTTRSVASNARIPTVCPLRTRLDMLRAVRGSVKEPSSRMYALGQQRTFNRLLIPQNKPAAPPFFGAVAAV